MRLLSSLLVILSLAACCWAVPEYASTVRAPSFPLAVRTPYSSIWLPANELPGHWPVFWHGTTKGWLGLIRVDGSTYEWMGAAHVQGDSPIQNVAQQNAHYVTPTQTIFHLTAGPVDLNVTFFSPVEYNDIERQSLPLSYVFVTVTPNDGAAHDVQVYMDITGEWASSEDSSIITWKVESHGGLKTWSTERQTQWKFSENRDFAQWGQAVMSTTDDATHASASDKIVRATFVSLGQLDNTHDSNYRCVSCDWPTFAFAHDLGSISSTSRTLQFTVGHVREDNINLMLVAQKALWTHYHADLSAMIEFFYNDVDGALTRSEALDNKILGEAFSTGGQDYVDIAALSLRQAYGALEWSGNITHPLLYLKEISSNGNMQTVDVIYPFTPVLYYLNVDWLKYLLEPLFFQMENGYWPKPYSMHDIGFNFPNATGHPDGVQEDMPVEESANMILMVGNIVLNPSSNADDSRTYLLSHYNTLVSWAEYLVDNCLYPVHQLTTDDFIGPTELNSGLALKGILGLKTFAKLSAFLGYDDIANIYNDIVATYIVTWEAESIHNDGTHLKMEYNVTNGYQFKYNAFQDKLLSLNTVPENVYELEAAYYLTLLEPYGIPFVSTHDYTKTDWEIWTAGAFGYANPELRTSIIHALALYLKYTPARVPFSDWYVTATSNQVGFQARPVVGGHFGLLALNTPAAP